MYLHTQTVIHTSHIFLLVLYACTQDIAHIHSSHTDTHMVIYSHPQCTFMYTYSHTIHVLSLSHSYGSTLLMGRDKLTLVRDTDQLRLDTGVRATHGAFKSGCPGTNLTLCGCVLAPPSAALASVLCQQFPTGSGNLL